MGRVGVGRGRVATPGVCIIESRRMGGWRETSEADREIGALCGCTYVVARRLAIASDLKSAREVEV